MNRLISGDSFVVDPDLLERAGNGDGEAQYQIGLQALSEGRFGFARVFFKLAHKQNYPLAWKYYLLAHHALAELSAEAIG